MPRITTAPVGQRQHQQQQIGRYLASMAVRTGCFVGALLAWQLGVRGGEGTSRVLALGLVWLLLAGAVILPYVAVLAANAGRETVKPTTTAYVPPTPVQIPAATGPVVVADEPLVGTVTDPPAGPPDDGDDDLDDRGDVAHDLRGHDDPSPRRPAPRP